VDVLWTGPAGTGQMLEVPVVLTPRHLVLLQAGEPVRLSAIKNVADADPEALYTVELTTVNQVPTTQMLLGYMANQLAADLTRLAPPRGR
jgi:hypothetical protein